MEITLKFVLPEEKDDHHMYIRAPEYRFAIYDFLEALRNKIKYQELPPEERELYEGIQALMITCLEDRGVLNDF